MVSKYKSLRDDCIPMMEEALSLQNQRRFEESIEVVLAVLLQNPRFAPAFGTLGRAYYELADYENAAEAFRSASRLSPMSELASLGLFHSLFKLGRFEEAKAEIDRFNKVSSSNIYEGVLDEIIGLLQEDQ